MAGDLRDRVLAAVRKGLVGPLDTSKSKKPVLQGYSLESAIENGVTAQATCNIAFANEIKDVTPLHPFSAKRDSQPGKEPAGPSLAYRATSVGPDGAGAVVEIVELPAAGRYRKVFGVLQLRPPALVPVERWQRCVEDGKRFLAKWGEQAESLGWSSADLFGLHTPPARPHPSYNRLSRYDCTGLCWLLQGRPVVALTETTATIRNPRTGVITTYRRFNKPALGPLGDSLLDIDPRRRQ
jgi:hypothetical protein